MNHWRHGRPLKARTLGLAGLVGLLTLGMAEPAAALSPVPPTPVVQMCVGAEGYHVVTERQPSVIVLECEAYGPQYGNPNVAVLRDLAWSRWGRTSAAGYGMLAYGDPLVCPPSGPCSGGDVTWIVARVRLSDPKGSGTRGDPLRFSTVRVTVSALPGVAFGRQVLTYHPPRRAYS
jgi:hypothetical protein